MKLVVATPLYPPEPGGPATYAKLLEEGLPAQGHTVELVKFRDVRKYPKVVRHIAYMLRVRHAARNADLVLALDPVSTGLPALLAARSLGKPFVVKVVGDFAWEQGRQRFGVQESLDEFVQKVRLPFAVACFRWIETRVARSATRVIVPSDYLKTIVMAWGVSAEKISVIYNAIELPEHIPAASESFKSLSSPRILTAARLVPWKGIDELIEATAVLQNTFPSVTLTVVGEGTLRSELETQSQELIPAHALFTGALPHEDTLALMRDADVFVLNSSYEGLSHVLIEALMLGKVIVTTRAGGNPELITDGENGILVAVGDTSALTEALKQVLGDEGLRARLQARALESSRRFTIDLMLKATHELLNSLI